MSHPVSGRIQIKFVEGTSEESIEKFFNTLPAFNPHIFYPGLEYAPHPEIQDLWMMRLKHSSEGTAMKYISGYRIVEKVEMADSDVYDRFVRLGNSNNKKHLLHILATR